MTDKKENAKQILEELRDFWGKDSQEELAIANLEKLLLKECGDSNFVKSLSLVSSLQSLEDGLESKLNEPRHLKDTAKAIEKFDRLETKIKACAEEKGMNPEMKMKLPNPNPKSVSASLATPESQKGQDQNSQ